MTAIQLLLDHVDGLRRMHRAGENPTYGQVETLFDLAIEARAQFEERPLDWHARLRVEPPRRVVVGCDSPAIAKAVLRSVPIADA
jgi:hypothetical protein